MFKEKKIKETTMNKKMKDSIFFQINFQGGLIICHRQCWISSRAHRTLCNSECIASTSY